MVQKIVQAPCTDCGHPVSATVFATTDSEANRCLYQQSVVCAHCERQWRFVFAVQLEPVEA